ncbi:hypothetical protein Leryth_000013 [Lithospermum erythrorhizon]|nr:hypothetical protein Leryth_000013 [Lithospermum erythrorhizon]
MQTNNLDLHIKRNNDQEQQHAEHLKCPRCFSSNTKFCYYNNYNKSQPRHFCKGCKRHWTKGGTLRNVPLDGGRKNKRQKQSKSVAKRNISSVSSINHIASEGSNDSIIFSKPEDNNIGTSNNLIGTNNTFLESGHEMFSLACSQDQSKQFSNSENLDFGSSLPMFVPKNQSSDACKYTLMPDSSLESTMNTAMPMSGSNILSQKPWQDSLASGFMDLSSLCDWNEINYLVSADLDVRWDEAEMKF